MGSAIRSVIVMGSAIVMGSVIVIGVIVMGQVIVMGSVTASRGGRREYSNYSHVTCKPGFLW